MALNPEFVARLADALAGVSETTLVEPKRGEAIFADTDYPRTWGGFVGQEKAKEQLHVQCASASARGARIEHTLLASGIHGVGKTTLATLTAFHAGAGFVQTTGPLDQSEFRKLAKTMQDRDVLFIDEIHLMAAGNRNRADWLLPFMTEGVLYTERGAEKMPDIAIVGATTDVGKLPLTLISRFMVQPAIVPYTEEEGAQIAGSLAARMGVEVTDADHLSAVARAADNNPRVMRQILTAVRDLQYAYPELHPNLDKAFEWSGVAADGLPVLAREILLLLIMSEGHTASVDSLRAQLAEPGPLRHPEQALLQRGLITISGRGRKLTDAGMARGRQELMRVAS